METKTKLVMGGKWPYPLYNTRELLDDTFRRIMSKPESDLEWELMARNLDAVRNDLGEEIEDASWKEQDALCKAFSQIVGSHE